MADGTYSPKVYRKNGGDTLVVAAGGAIEIEPGGTITSNGVDLMEELDALNGLDATELGYLNGVVAGTVVADKAVVAGTGKVVDELDITLLKVGGVTKTNVLIGAAAGYKLARSASPVALDGSNPTSVAHGLTTAVACGVSFSGTAAPGLSTSTLAVAINGANLDVYAWKPTGAGDTTLVASTGTESFHWWAIGT